MPKSECYAEDVVNQPIDVVWNIITDSSKFHALKLPGVYSPFAREDARSGIQFEYKSIMGNGETYPRYIVAWKPTSHFSFGHSSSEWDFEWHLNPNGEKTSVRFARRSNANFFEWAANQIFGDSTLQKLTDETVASLKDACSRLASGKDEGLTPYRW